MSGVECPSRVIITSQADIENFPACANADALLIEIVNATENLNFTSVTGILEVSVHDSPQLKGLWCPLARGVNSITLSHARLLSDASFPSDSEYLTISINDTPSLDAIYLGNTTSLQEVNLTDTGPLQLDSVTSIGRLQMISPCRSFEASLCIPSFYVLGSVADLILRNINYIHFESPLIVNNSLTIDNSSQDQADPWHSVPPSAKIITIGSNASLTSNSNFPLDLTSLTTLGDTLSVINNTNCSLNFDALTRARALVLLDNIDTTLPAFPTLERVSDVHLRGNIITSSGPNIFPSLKFAPGAVIVEAWNDFNCSKLVSQQREGIINSLICHGTNNGTDDGTGNMTANGVTGPVSSSSSLSAGAWAGIVVGIAIAVLSGSVATWLMLRFRRNLKNLREQMGRDVQDGSGKSPTLPPNSPDGLHEMEAQRITRELQHDYIGEMEVRPSEMPDDYIHEVQSIPQELPSDGPAQDTRR